MFKYARYTRALRNLHTNNTATTSTNNTVPHRNMDNKCLLFGKNVVYITAITGLASGSFITIWNKIDKMNNEISGIKEDISIIKEYLFRENEEYLKAKQIATKESSPNLFNLFNLFK
ncbi:hypothetical protein C1645_817249 [Glomus cerebriforme]|uniref:Uncharacterized protein n=1 Tax=Glomus cerebriforme TaxID=658196 RepID=A0A397TDH6_9GLOM|nr:hypothetical protein C1645_817249 [Glomus cerebriforme]